MPRTPIDPGQAVRAFKLGVLSLEERAAVDLMFDATCQRIAEVAAGADLPLPDALRPDAAPHTQMYHVNMSGACHGVGWRWCGGRGRGRCVEGLISLGAELGLKGGAGLCAL